MATINELLSLVKTVRERKHQLERIRDLSVVKERTFNRFGTEEERLVSTREPQVNIESVDAKVAELEIWLFKADAAIKQANATVQVKLEADVDKLLEAVKSV